MMVTQIQEQVVDNERATLLRMLEEQRDFLRFTVRDLTEEQARERATRSGLTLGGLVKHLIGVERSWTRFILEGAVEMNFGDPDVVREHEDSFRLTGDETLAGTLEEYARTAEETARVVTGLPNLDVSHKLPVAPWFPEDTSWSAREVVVHLVRETAQHCGHADIIRETIDGQKTMG